VCAPCLPFLNRFYLSHNKGDFEMQCTCDKYCDYQNNGAIQKELFGGHGLLLKLMKSVSWQ